MERIKLTAICFLLGACTTHPSLDEGDLWLTFQERCLTPVLANRDIVTQGLQEIPPATIFTEEDAGSPLPPTAIAFRPSVGSWKLFAASEGNTRLCAVLSQSDGTAAKQAATKWAENAVTAKGFMYDHHTGTEIEKRVDDLWVEVSFGGAHGWKTGFIVSTQEATPR